MFNKIKEKNISNSFEASLSFAGEEKVAEYSLAKEDQLIEKYAGIDIYQPTVDNVEQFVRKYVMNEMSFFPKTLEIHTFLNPSTFDSVHQDYVKEATGLVTIRLHDAKLELPFIVTDGELVPFDVIQYNGQRVPYSRENIKRVLYGVDKQFADKVNGAHGNNIGDFSPYVKTEKPANPSTSPGFLGNVLQIQEQHIRRRGDDMYSTASLKLDEGLEKLASMKELTMKEVEALHNEFKKQVHEEFKGQLDKFAAEIESHDDRAELKLFSNIQNLQFENASSLPSGTFISFPEKNGKEMCMTKGVVVDNYMTISGRKFKASKVVVAEDGRVKFLDNSEKFLCFKSDAKFSLPTTSLSGVKRGDMFMAFNGDKAIPPSYCDNITERGLKRDGNTGVNFRIVEAETAGTTDKMTAMMGEAANALLSNSNDKKDLKRFRICPLEGAKFTEMTYKDYIAKLSEQTGIDVLQLSNVLSIYNVKVDYGDKDTVFCADPDSVKVIRVTGTIENYMRNKEDMRKMSETTGEFSMPKLAGAGDSIYIKSIDKQRRVYFVQIKYTDKSKAMFNQMTKEYKDVPEAGVKQILRVLGFDGGQSSEMLFKTREMGSVNMNLPSTARVDMLTGANVINRSTDQVKNVMKKVVSPEAVGDAVMSSVLGAMMTGAIASRGGIQSGTPDSAREALRFASKFASEAEALSVAFEKVAGEHQSQSMLKVAKLMSEGALLHNKVAEVINGTCYPRLTEAAYDIVQGKDELERIACDLMELKYNQYHNGDHIINPNYIQGAIVALDNMYKVANELVDKDERLVEKVAEFREQCRDANLAKKKAKKDNEHKGYLSFLSEKVKNKTATPEEHETFVKMIMNLKEKEKGEQKQADFRDDNGFNTEELRKKQEKADDEDDRVCSKCHQPIEKCKCGGKTEKKAEEFQPQLFGSDGKPIANQKPTQMGMQPINQPADMTKSADNHYLEPQSDDVSTIESEVNPIESDNNDSAIEAELNNTETDDAQSQKTAGILDETANSINKGFKSKWTNLAHKEDAVGMIPKSASEAIDEMFKQANILQEGAQAAKKVSSGLGATYGALGGAALGGVAGAAGAQDGQRAQGALKGGAIGALAGAGAGAVGGHALAQGAAKTYQAGLKTGVAAGAVGGAGLGAAATHFAQNPEAVQGAKNMFNNVVNKFKGEAGAVAHEGAQATEQAAQQGAQAVQHQATGAENLANARQEAQQNINNVPHEVMPQQQPQQSVIVDQHGNPIQTQQPVNQPVQPQAQPGAQPEMQQTGVQGQQPVVQPHSIDVNQQPMPQTDSSTVEGVTQGNYQQYELPQNGGQQVDAVTGAGPGQQVVNQHAQDGTQQPGVLGRAKQNVSNWWNNVRGNNPDTTNAVADTEEGIKNQASDVIELMYQEKLASDNWVNSFESDILSGLGIPEEYLKESPRQR